MLTKKQTLCALPILIVTFGALCLIGYISEELFLGRNAGVTTLILLTLIVNFFALIFIFFSIFVSFGTALIFNAANSDSWQKTGNPFYHLLWRELQETTRHWPVE